MIIVESRGNVPIRLTIERWSHIVAQHPEMMTQRDHILETIRQPDMIQAGDFGEMLAVRLYPRTPLTQKYLIVAYRELSSADGFILTAYFARRPSARRSILWKP